MGRPWLILAAALLGTTLLESAVSAPAIYVRSVQAPEDVVYDAVYHGLEASRFSVIFEPDIGRTLARNGERWGQDYNRNGFETIRSLVSCHPWYANQLSNLAPEALVICPFHVTFLYADGVATVAFQRPTAIVSDGPAKALVAEIENGIVTALDHALDDVEAQQ